MALHELLTSAISQTLTDHQSDLDAFVAQRALPPETATHLAQTVRAIPGLLISVDGALFHNETPRHARDLFVVVFRYLLLEDDLIPMRGDNTVVAMLDDTYLLHRAVQELRDHIEGVDMRSIDGGVQLLTSVLEPEVVRRLDEYVASAAE